MKEAMFYEALDNGKVKCGLCSHRCTIETGRRGICGVRENREGTLYSLVYGHIAAMNNDPIEKKPLFHFLPGSKAFSISTVGCNFRCEHCQNFDISQYPRSYPQKDMPGEVLTPKQIVELAERSGSKSIAYTYTEPTIFLEFALDTALIAKEKNIRNVFVSNGFMTPESASFMAGILDGNNIDLKGDADFYKKICHARVEPVKETIEIMKAQGVWVEVTTLVIPDHNDSEEILRGIARFLSSVDQNIPWHVTQFYPTYHLLDKPRTPVETLKMAQRIGFEEGLQFVYEGNVPGEGGENTHCPSCRELLISRFGFSITRNMLQDGKCPKCGYRIAGVWV